MTPKEYINDPAFKVILRDVFACIALSTLDIKNKSSEQIAQSCYNIANQMIEERSKIRL